MTVTQNRGHAVRTAAGQRFNAGAYAEAPLGSNAGITLLDRQVREEGLRLAESWASRFAESRRDQFALPEGNVLACYDDGAGRVALTLDSSLGVEPVYEFDPDQEDWDPVKAEAGLVGALERYADALGRVTEDGDPETEWARGVAERARRNHEQDAAFARSELVDERADELVLAGLTEAEAVRYLRTLPAA